MKNKQKIIKTSVNCFGLALILLFIVLHFANVVSLTPLLIVVILVAITVAFVTMRDSIENSRK
jgi:hypothetical protein